jgi:hypothetical protein
MLWLLLGPSYVDTSAATDSIAGTFAVSLALAGVMEFEPREIGSDMSFEFGESGTTVSIASVVSRFSRRGLTTPAGTVDD